MRMLEARGYWRLPTSQNANHLSGRWRPRRLGQPVALPKGVLPRAEQVQGLKLVEVTPAQMDLFRTWNELIEREHRLHQSRMVGRQLRYLVGTEHGWLGAVGFGSCALRLADGDAWHGSAGMSPSAAKLACAIAIDYRLGKGRPIDALIF